MASKLNRASIPMTAKKVFTMMKKGNMRFDNPIQRPLTWEKSRKSGLIHSLIENYPVPPLYARKDGDEYDFLDGKQRLNSIFQYMNGEYALEGVPPITYEPDDGDEDVTIDVNGLHYHELPQELQDSIADYSLLTYYFDGITAEQARTMFQKLNNGKPLSTQAKNIAYCADLDNVARLGSHELFQMLLTPKALESRKQIPIVMKMWMMLFHDTPSFESRVFNGIIQNTIISVEESETLNTVFNRIMEVYTRIDMTKLESESRMFKRRLAMETHLVSFAPIAYHSIVEGRDDVALTEFFCYFFNGEKAASISDPYNEVSKNGAAKANSIAIRNAEIVKAYNEFFKVDKEE